MNIRFFFNRDAAFVNFVASADFVAFVAFDVIVFIAFVDNVFKIEFIVMMRTMQTIIEKLQANQQQTFFKKKINKSLKPKKYENGTKGTYNDFIRQMKKRFANEGIIIHQIKIHNASIFLKDRSNEIWEIYVKHHVDFILII